MRASLAARWIRALTLGTCLLIAGCSDRHEAADAGPIDGGGTYLSCTQARDDLAVGEPCAFVATCEDPGACCTTTWSCAGGVVASERTCAETCWRSCAEALEGAAEGDPCEGSFDCSMFDDTLCCSRSVLCLESRISVDEMCTPGCS